MINKDLQEVKPIYIHETGYSANNEVNLVDLALIIMQRKKLAIFVFIVFLVLGVVFSISQTSVTSTHYNYETSINIGNRTVEHTTVYLEPPATILSNIQYSYIPYFLSETKKNYNITANIQPGSGIILLKTSSAEPDDKIAINLLKTISNKAIADHNKYYETIKSSLQSIKDPINPTDTALQLASLKNTTALTTPRITKTTETANDKNPKLILAISITSGLIVALFSIFFAEFIAKVKERKNETIN